jgi:membrane protein
MPRYALVDVLQRGNGVKRIKTVLKLFKEAAIGWSDDNVSIHGAALSYYTIFSIAPLLLVAIAIAGLVLGQQASQGEIFGGVRRLLGDDGARSIEGLVHSASLKPHAGLVATVLGFVTLIFGASGVFTQLQQSLNIIWRVTTEPGKGVWVFIRRRLLTFSMVVVIGFILLVTLVVSAAISALGEFVGDRLPGGEALWHVVNVLVSFGVTTALLAAVLKVLPDVELGWRDVWLGSAVTAALFTVGRLGIALYLGHSGVASSYGAAGSLIVVLLWVYYASQIVYFGAEFTRAHVRHAGRAVRAKEGSKLIEPSAVSPEIKPGQAKAA